MDAPRGQSRPVDLYHRGLQVCAITMLAALAAGFWGYFAGPSLAVFVIAAIAAVVGTLGIGMVTYGYFSGDWMNK
jgi:hypothetical protein